MATSTVHGRTFAIGELARKAGVSTRTIRYYEELGVLPAPRRGTGGTRRYDPGDVDLVSGIRVLVGLGFRLSDVAQLNRLANGDIAAWPHALAAVRRQLAEAKRSRRLLGDLMVSIPADDRPGNDTSG